MAFGDNQSTLTAEKRPTMPGEVEAFSVKRRRVTLQDVEDELRAAGLCQPALSLFRGAEQDVVDIVASNSISLKRDRDQDPAVSGLPVSQPAAEREVLPQLGHEPEKRRRLCAQSEPLYTAKSVTEMSPSANIESCIINNCSLVPYPASRSFLGSSTQVVVGDFSPTIPRLIDGPTSIAVDPLGLTFIVGNGFLMAELPLSRRPVCSLSGEQATKIVIDIRGKALFLSESGQIVASVPAVRQLENAQDCNSRDLTLQILGTRSESNSMPLAIRVLEDKDVAGEAEEVFSPSTDVPSPSTEDVEDDDMETD